MGTFAIYHRTAREPSAEEIEAIGMITEHVARAIVLARGVQDLDEIPKAPRLRLVSDDSDGDLVGRWPSRLLARVERLEELAAEPDRQAEHEDSDEARENLRSAATDSRNLISAIRQRIENAG